jgi:hypothetical protein
VVIVESAKEIRRRHHLLGGGGRVFYDKDETPSDNISIFQSRHEIDSNIVDLCGSVTAVLMRSGAVFHALK